MSESNNEAVEVELEAGKMYMFCTCGRTTNSPFCDFKHMGSGYQPQSMKIEKSGKYSVSQGEKGELKVVEM